VTSRFTLVWVQGLSGPLKGLRDACMVFVMWLWGYDVCDNTVNCSLGCCLPPQTLMLHFRLACDKRREMVDAHLMLSFPALNPFRSIAYP